MFYLRITILKKGEKITIPIIKAVEASSLMSRGDFPLNLPESDIMEIDDLSPERGVLLTSICL